MGLLAKGRPRGLQRNKKDILVPTEGLDYSLDATLIRDRRLFGQNVEVTLENIVQKKPGYVKLGTMPVMGGDPILNMHVFELSSGAKQLLRASKKYIEKYNTATKEFDNVTGGQELTGGEQQIPHFATATELDKCIVSNYKDKMKVYNGNSNFEELAGNPPKAKTIEWFSPYLLAGNLEDQGQTLPFKLKWPDSGNIENWTSGNSGSKILAHDTSPIRRIMRLNNEAHVYKQKSVYAARQVDTSQAIDVDIFRTDVGLFSSRGVVGRGGVHWFIGSENFHENNGIRIEDIGDAVKSRVISRMNAEKPEQSWAMLYEELNEVWFFICTTGNDYATEVWKYNYKTRYWYFDTVANITAGANYQVIETRRWLDLIGPWSAQNYSWDSRSGGAAAPIQVYGNSVGRSFKRNPSSFDEDGVAIDSYVDTIDFVADRFENRKDWLELDLYARGNSVRVSYSTDQGKTFKFIKEYQLGENFPQDPLKVYHHVNSSMIRYRFANGRSGQTFGLKQFAPYFLVEEQN